MATLGIRSSFDRPAADAAPASSFWHVDYRALALVAMVVCCVVWNVASAVSFQSPIVIGDEFFFLMNGRFYNNLEQLRADHPEIAFFGTSIFDWMISKVPKDNPAPGTVIKLVNSSFILLPVAVYATMMRRRMISLPVLLAFVLLADPLNLFRSYVMPDALYADAFLATVAACLHLSTRYSDVKMTAAALGFGLTILCFIKPHGLFLMTACAASLFLAAAVERRITLALSSCAAYVGTIVLSTLVLGFLFSPRNHFNINFIGPFYSGTVSNYMMSLSDRAAQFLVVFYHQDVTWLMLMAPATIYLANRILARVRNGSDIASTPSSYLRTVFSLLPLVAACEILGSVSWIYYTDGNIVHFRYVGFLIPGTLLIACWLEVPSNQVKATSARRLRLIAGGTWAAGALAFYWMYRDLRLLPVFDPEVFFAYNDQEFGHLNVLGSTGLTLGVLTVWTAAALLAFTGVHWLKLQLGALCLLFVAANVNVARWQQSYPEHLAFYNEAGEMAHAICGGRNKLTVALTTVETAGAFYMPLFHVLGPSQMIIVEKAQPLSPRTIRDADCVLSFIDISELGYHRINLDYGLALYMKTSS